MKEIITYAPQLQRFFDLWHRAHDLTDAAAQFALAKIYLKSKQQDTVKKAFALFKKLANQDYTTAQTDAQYMLGQCYENGYGIQKSYPRAIRWYKMAGLNVGHDVCNAMGQQLHKELEAALNTPEGGEITPEMVDFIIDEAESGDVRAQKYLMNLYQCGDGPIEANDEQAAYWTQKAAENGDAEAIAQLGRMYYYGQGVERNLRKGLDLMEEAAEKGSDSSAYTLGRHYERMTATKKAAEWYRIYAEAAIKRRNKQLGWKA